MIKTAFLAVMSLSLLFMAISAQGQQNFGQTDMDSQYLNKDYPSDQYSSTVPSGAPVPVEPYSPQELGLSTPTLDSSFAQSPPTAEAGQSLIASGANYAADLANADNAASSMQFAGKKYTGDVKNTQYSSGNTIQSMMVLAQGVVATNKLYVSSVPQTIAGCAHSSWLPMWLQTTSSGPVWFYEWYPSGRLSVNYLGIASGGWQKKWFNADTPGWHILQYNSRGWSNYIYIYVYPASSGRWTDQGPYTDSTSMTAPSYSGTSTVTLRSSWLMGYDVYLDGNYIGTEGKVSDILDGVYNFRVPGDMWHNILISKNGQSYEETGTFVSGAAYRFTI
jgi:hypothetical protein